MSLLPHHRILLVGMMLPVLVTCMWPDCYLVLFGGRKISHPDVKNGVKEKMVWQCGTVTVYWTFLVPNNDQVTFEMSMI